jgi:hypothetical protein
MKKAAGGFGAGYRVQISKKGLKTVRYWVNLFENEAQYRRAYDD